MGKETDRQVKNSIIYRGGQVSPLQGYQIGVGGGGESPPPSVPSLSLPYFTYQSGRGGRGVGAQLFILFHKMWGRNVVWYVCDVKAHYRA